MGEAWLLVEASADPLLGVSVGGVVVKECTLPTGRRHNRDLVPAMRGIVMEAGFSFDKLAGIRAGTGPGSYTGLRIGLTAAKALAYALGKPLVAVPSFTTIAHRTPADVARVDVIGDALNRTVYVQRFGPMDAATKLRPALDDVHIEALADYLTKREAEARIGGPGASTFAAELPQEMCLPPETRTPDVPTMERVGRTILPLGRTEMMALEPLYLRGSSAEEKARSVAELARVQEPPGRADD